MIIKTLSIFVFTVSSMIAFCQPRQYVFNRLSSNEGLASNFVYTIFQDRSGFMWFGTANGLQRYDGKKIMQFTPPPGSSGYLPRVSISQMFQDRSGKIWIRCGKEIGIFDPSTFRYKRTVIKGIQDADATAAYKIWQNHRGEVFLIISRVGVLTYDSSTNEFANNIPYQIKSPAHWSVNVICEEPGGDRYWLGCDSGLALYDRRTNNVYSRYYNPQNLRVFQRSAQDPITVLYLDNQKKLWLTAWRHSSNLEVTASYDITSDLFTDNVSGLKTGGGAYPEMLGFLQHSSGVLWAFGRTKLFSFDARLNRFNYIRDKHLDDFGIKYDNVFCMYEDKEQNLWFGTDHGVYAMNPAPQTFKTVKAQINGESSDVSVTGFVETDQNELFVSTCGSGLLKFDSNFLQQSENVIRNFPIRDDNYRMQWSLYKEVSANRLWVGCQSGRLIIHDLDTKKALFLQPSEFGEKSIRHIMGDHKGNIWFGTEDGRLLKWSNKNQGLELFANGLQPVAQLKTIIYKIIEDKDGFIWAATHAYGLIKIDALSGSIVARYTTRSGIGNSLYSDIVTDVIQYNDTTMIVAAGAINFLNIKTGTIRKISSDDGLPSNTAVNIQDDGNGSLWISLLSGLCRYNVNKNIFTSYSHRDGIFYDNYQVGASYKLKNGNIIFGNTHDFVFFQPGVITSVATPPDVRITGFKLFNNYLTPDSILKLSKVDLDYKQAAISIEFSAISFLQRDKLVYYYTLEGIDKDVFRTDRLMLANYTQLPPGEYIFKVWCENGDGLKSKNVTTLRISVHPPFWKTWWFILAIAVAVSCALYFGHRLKIARLMDMEQVRKRIARDLHDDMGSTLSTINILSEMAKMKVTSDQSKTKEFIEKISDNSTRMMEAMDDIVWSINPTNDSMQKITARMREFAAGVLEAKGIEYSFIVENGVADLKLDMESRRDLFLLFKEAINNLAKYSGSKNVSMEMKTLRSCLVMSINDDGIGFNPSQTSNGNGLFNMKKRAESLRGKLAIQSVIGKGTSIRLEAPLH